MSDISGYEDEPYFGGLQPVIDLIFNNPYSPLGNRQLPSPNFGSSWQQEALKNIPANQRPVADFSLPNDQRQSQYNIDVKRAAGIPMGGYAELDSEGIPESFMRMRDEWLQGRGPSGANFMMPDADYMVPYDSLLAPPRTFEPSATDPFSPEGQETLEAAQKYADMDYGEYADFVNMFNNQPLTSQSPEGQAATALDDLLAQLDALEQEQVDAAKGAAAGRYNRSMEHLREVQAKNTEYYDDRDTAIATRYNKYIQDTNERFDDWYADTTRREEAVADRAADMGIDLAISSDETTSMLQSQQASSIDYLNTIEGIAKDISNFSRKAADDAISDAMFKVGLQYESALASINARQKQGEIDDLRATIELKQQQEQTAIEIGMLSTLLQANNVDPDTADLMAWLQIKGITDAADDTMDFIRTELGKEQDPTIDISYLYDQPAGTTYATSQELAMMQQVENLIASMETDPVTQEAFLLQSPEGYDIPFLDLDFMLKNPEGYNTLVQMGALPPIEAYDQDMLNAIVSSYIMGGQIPTTMG